ncbi:acyl-CoA thioesterase [Oceanobacillus kimchii]|uniref:acyl-CoA thioesterase n=1 Tax=Oceanobacillus kimchii TaxID=746691 RepID=UPI000985F98E|nr:thioesterase family protein [Oceanobacillus kimchii]
MYTTIIEPRVSETDALGHINNTTIPIWLEASRNPMFKLFMPDLSFNEWKLIIVNTNTNFKKEIFFGENVQIHTLINKIGNSSFQLYEEIWQNEQLCVESNVTYVNYNLKDKVTEQIPDNIRVELKKHYRTSID